MSTPRTQSDHYFGGCPECGDTDGFMNVGGNHWFICNQHRTKWPPGYNLFSCWHEEDEAEWKANAERLCFYRQVAPMLWEPTPEEKEQMARAVIQAPYIDPLDNEIPF